MVWGWGESKGRLKVGDLDEGGGGGGELKDERSSVMWVDPGPGTRVLKRSAPLVTDI